MAVGLLLLCLSLGKSSSVPEISAADLLQHFPVVPCLGRAEGYLCPVLSCTSFHEGFTWVNLVHTEAPSAFCIARCLLYLAILFCTVA